MAFYLAVFVKEGDQYCVSFPDVPEAFSQGDNLADATLMAEDALLTAMDFYREDKRKLQRPSEIHLVSIHISNDVVNKINFLDAPNG